MDDNSEKLRAKAKEELRKGKIIDTSLYETDMKVLVEELSIYQIELEHQNQELMLSQEQLQQSNNRYLDLFDNAPIGYLIVDSTGIIKDINQTACKLLECSKNEFIDTKISKIIHPDFQDIYYLYFRTLIHQKHQQPCDIKLRKANNTTFYARIQGVCQTHETDHEAEFRLAISDITFQKEMEIKLLAAKALTEQSEIHFKVLFDDAPDAMLLADPESGKIVDANNAASLLFKKQKQELVGLLQYELHPPKAIDMSKSTFKTQFEEKEETVKNLPVENSILCSDGTEIPVEILGRPIRIGEKNLMFGIFRDITERRKAEDKIIESEENFRAIFENNSAAIAIIEADTTISLVNDAYCKLSGYQPVDVIGKSWTDQIPPQDLERLKEYNRIRLVNPKDAPEKYEFTFYRKDGEIRNALMSISIIESRKKIITSFTDITDRKHAEELFIDIIDKNPMSIQIVDKEGHTIQTNPAFSKLFGFIPPSEYSIFEDLISKGPDFETLIHQTISGEVVHLPDIYYNVHDLLPEAPDNPLWIRAIIFPLKDSTGKPERFVIMHENISERKESEIALKQSEEKFAVAFKTSPYAITITRPDDGKFIEVNDAFFSMTGYSPEEALNSSSIGMDLWINAEDRNNVLKVLRNGGTINGQEFHFKKKNGEIITGLFSAQRIDIKNKTYILSSINDITERKKAEEELKTEKTRLSLIIEGTNAATWEWNIQTGETIFNKRWAEIIGYKLDEIMPVSITTWEEYCHPDDFIKASELINKHFAGEIDYYEIETRMRHKNGNWVWVLDRGRVHTWTEDGKPLLMAGTHQDITERKLAELLLENERALYLDLVNTQPAGIYRIRVFPKTSWEVDAWTKADSTPYKMELVSNRFCEILEIDPQKFESHPGILVDLVHPDDKEEFVRRNEEANTLISIFSWDCRLLINNNIKWIHFESLPRKLENGDILFTGIIYDITEQKIAQEKLRDSEMRFRKILQDVESLSVQGYAPDGTTQYWNKASERLYGYTAEEAIGKKFTDLIIPSEMRDGVKQAIIQMAETGQAIPASELTLKRKDGSLVSVFSNHTIVQIAGQPQELFCIDIDLTELKKAEEALRKSEERYSSLMQYLETGIVVHAADTSIVMCNPRASEIMGLTIDQMKGKTAVDPAWKFLDEDKTPLMFENYPVNRIKNSKKPIKNQIIGIQKSINKDFTWGNINGFPVLNNDGEITEIVISFNDITQRIIVQKKLHENNDLLNKLTAQIPGVVYQYRLYPDGSSAFPYSSNGMYEIYEVTPEEVREDASPVFTRLHPDDYDYIVETITESARNQTAYQSEFRVILPQQGLRWRYCAAKPELLEDGSTLWHGIISDITERKEAEESLKNSQKLLSETEKIGNVGGWEYYYNSGIMNWTEETYNIHELQYDKNVSLDAGINFYTPEAIPIINHAVQQAIEFSIPFDLELDIITIKGNIRTVHTIGKCDSENHRVYGFFQDITNRKKAEEALQESEQKLSALFNGMTEMTVIHELTFDDNNRPNNYRIIECNQAFTKITGIEPENAIGKLATEVYGTEVAPYLQEYSSVCLTNTNYNFQIYYQPIDKHFLVSVVSIGENRFATITADISDIERAKEFVLEKNKELENLIYVASHDLRSPLVNIQGFSQRLENQTSEIVKLAHQHHHGGEIQDTIDKISNVEIPKSLGYIKSNITKMDSLINGLLKLSRTGRILMNISEINMNTLFQSIINTHQFELSELDAIVEIDSLTNCFGDENQLNQLFSNIIANAIKYRDKNKQLTLKINSKTQSNKVVYAITDNGIGINNKYLPKIWDIFYRVNPTKLETGEGLGLSVARKITEKHKGKVWVESEVGVGSTFYVELLQNKFEE